MCLVCTHCRLEARTTDHNDNIILLYSKSAIFTTHTYAVPTLLLSVAGPDINNYPYSGAYLLFERANTTKLLAELREQGSATATLPIVVQVHTVHVRTRADTYGSAAHSLFINY